MSSSASFVGIDVSKDTFDIHIRPSGQSQTRKMLTWEEVRNNAATYLQQVKTILSTDRKLFEVRYNSEWFLGRSPQNRLQGLETFDFGKWV